MVKLYCYRQERHWSIVFVCVRWCLYIGCQLAPQVLLTLACPLAPVPLPVAHDDEGVAQQLQMP
jgi:hypothetical protein